MMLIDEIEGRIQDFEKKAEEDLKIARIFEVEAISLEKNEVWDKSSKKYHDAANRFFRACVHLESIDLWHACKNIRNTLIYTQLVEFQDDDYVSKVAKTVEVCQLVEAGFEYVCEMDTVKIFRKRK